jgi:DNA-binding transcriptional MerR regulator
MQGKYAYYNSNHLHRLELIHRMKDSYLPLREIRQIINSLSDSEVRQRLQEQIPAPPTTEPEPAKYSGTKALEYIARLMDEQAAHRPQGTARPSQSGLPRSRGGQAPTPSLSPAAPVSVSEGETWQRIQLTCGVELSLRQPTDPDTSTRIQQLITFAQRLFA